MPDNDDTNRNAAVFAENVRREMRALSPDVVADLTDGLEADILASLTDGGTLPDPVEYARDLMRAAGMVVADAADTGFAGLIRRAVGLGGRCMGVVRNSTRGLAPAWWVFRAWVVMQMLGFVASGTDSPWWFLGQWGGEGFANGFVGVVVFVGFFYVSIRVGRDGWLLSGRQEQFVSAVLAVFALSVIFSYNTAQPFPGVYGDPNMWPGSTTVPPTDCREMPDLLGYDVVDATTVLASMGVPYRVIDEATNYDVTRAAGIAGNPGAARVTRQLPDPHGLSCGNFPTLYVELKVPIPTLPDGSPDTIQQSAIPEPTTAVPVPMGDVTTTTAPRNNLTTTTAFPSTATTTRSRASTTTAP